MNAYKIKSDDYKKYEAQFRKTFVGNLACLTTTGILLISFIMPLIAMTYDSIFANGNNFLMIVAFMFLGLLVALAATLQYFNMVVGYINSKKEE